MKKVEKVDVKSLPPEERKAYRKHRHEVRRVIIIGNYIIVALITIIAITVIICSVNSGKKGDSPEKAANAKPTPTVITTPTATPEPTPTAAPYAAKSTDTTKSLSSEIDSQYAIMINPATGKIIAEKNAYEKMYPASMIKVLTILTAANNLTPEDLDKPATISQEATDWSFSNGCSTAGFTTGESITVRDLFYGTILPSGGDAAAELAIYVAGSTDAFVELMNKEVEKLGLDETTHITNMIGIHDENHYSTAYDMAIIMQAALDNDICKPVLTAHTYNTTFSEINPEGLLMSNWFLRRIEYRDFGGTIESGKTGYTDEARFCAVSSEVTDGGKNYIVVTAKGSSNWTVIEDHAALYNMFREKTENKLEESDTE